MSNAQYLLLATFIGFYGLLFTYLLVRALAGVIGARFERAGSHARIDERRTASMKARRAWTARLSA